MNSVLLIGNSTFTNGLRSQVRGLDSLTVTASTSALEAFSLTENLAYDVIVVHASALRENSVVKTFGQDQAAYIVVIETDPIEAGLIETDPTDTSLYSKLTALHLEQTALALEAGADAYLWLPPSPVESELPSSVLGASSLEMRPEPSPEVAQTAAQKGGPAVLQSAQKTRASTGLTFQPDQCRLIQAHIQIGLSRAQRYRDLSRINDWLSAVALVDALTQINNRRAFDLELPNQVKMAKSKAAPLSIMILDIDYFKSVNDRFGHLVGDDILRQLAKRLLTNMRFYDTPFRFGGEEFVITLSNTDMREGKAIANRLRESIAKKPFPLTYANSDQVTSLNITVSVGLTELMNTDDEQGRSLLDRADQNLLKAKGKGRNQVVATP
ncbi:MAG: diguanylate cyclase [Phormidesmis sp.]